MHPKENIIIFSKEDCDKLELLASCLSLEEIATQFDIGLRTLEKIKERQPEVGAAYKRGVAGFKSRAVTKLSQYINNPDLNQTNLTATIFYLKTKGGFVDASKLVEREITKVKNDLIDIKAIEDPKEFVNKIDKAIAAIDLLLNKDRTDVK